MGKALKAEVAILFKAYDFYALMSNKAIGKIKGPLDQLSENREKARRRMSGSEILDRESSSRERTYAHTQYCGDPLSNKIVQ